MASVKTAHPGWERFVLLADCADGFFDPSAERFRTVEIRALPIPDRNAFFFRYSLLELSTATKPWFFRFLFQQGFERVLYLDPDIVLYAPLEETVRAWDAGAMAVLTPHLTGRVRDEFRAGRTQGAASRHLQPGLRGTREGPRPRPAARFLV